MKWNQLCSEVEKNLIKIYKWSEVHTTNKKAYNTREAVIDHFKVANEIKKNKQNYLKRPQSERVKIELHTHTNREIPHYYSVSLKPFSERWIFLFCVFCQRIRYHLQTENPTSLF